jgi:hypothetical protein
MNTARMTLMGGIVILLFLGMAACDREPSTGPQPEQSQARPEAAPEVTAPAEVAPNVVQVVTRDFTIEGPDQLPLGWHTFQFRNEGAQDHFVITYRLSEGKTIEDQMRGAMKPFEQVMEALQSGELEKAGIGEALGELLEPWVFENVYTSGPGLLAPGGETQATIRFDTPGTYLMECYVKSPEGKWHTTMGMLRQFEVVDEQGGVEEPSTDVEVILSNEGLQAPSSLPAGRTTVRAMIKDNPDSFMPYDVHLARFDEGADLEALVFWMDWSNVGGLRAPAPVEFLGGVENMPAGNHGYMTVDLTPGRYIWISEVNADRMHMVFEVE